MAVIAITQHVGTLGAELAGMPQGDVLLWDRAQKKSGIGTRPAISVCDLTAYHGSSETLHKINIIRRGLAGHKPIEAIERLLSFLKKFPTNKQMLKEIPG